MGEAGLDPLSSSPSLARVKGPATEATPSSGNPLRQEGTNKGEDQPDHQDPADQMSTSHAASVPEVVTRTYCRSRAGLTRAERHFGSPSWRHDDCVPHDHQSPPAWWDFAAWRRQGLSDRVWFGAAFSTCGVGAVVSDSGWWRIPAAIVLLVGVGMVASAVRRGVRRYENEGAPAPGQPWV